MMKTMTCRQLGGACDKEFHASTFEQMANLSKEHGMEMFEKGDEPHIKAMEKMKARMQSQETLNEWYNRKRKEFDALPDK